MKLSEMFPKKYASGADFKDKAVTLTIALIRTERMRPQPGAPEVQKFVIYFENATKGVILCKTLSYEIADAIGCDEDEDTSNWTGKRVTLYPVPMMVAGKRRIAIRARKPAASNGTAPPPATLSDEEGL